MRVIQQQGDCVHLPMRVIQQQGDCVHLPPANQVDREDHRGFPYGSLVKNLTTVQEMWVQSLGQEDPLEKGIPLLYSCLENPTDRGAWQAIVHGVAKSWTQLR